MQCAAISLEAIAAIVGVFVAASGVFVAAREFEQYRLKQRSEDAAKALVTLNSFINYIKAIWTNQGLYESRDYYPGSIPEIPLNDNERHSARPFRLIFNETNKFSEEFGEAIIKIAGKEFIRLNKMSDEIQQVARDLSILFPKETEDKKHSKDMLLEWNDKKQDLSEKIDIIRKEAESLLLSIIDGKTKKIDTQQLD